jgi:hypothetical protein
MRTWLRNKAVDVAARFLTKPRRTYRHLLPHDLASLRSALQPGDVMLIDGDQRISEVIKYLTQSTWSHIAFYVGDEILRRFPAQRDALAAQHGEDAKHMLIEALMDGVVASPVAKYGRFNVRVCRPIGLRRDDLERILDEVVGQLGFRYDVKNIVDLGRHFFPVSLVPERFRRPAWRYGSGRTTDVICSSMIGRAFQNVGFPILPLIEPAGPGPAASATKGWRRWWSARHSPYPTVFQRQTSTIITPRDFDLSPYFEIVKVTPLGPAARRSFDYRRIRWA